MRTCIGRLLIQCSLFLCLMHRCRPCSLLLVCEMYIKAIKNISRDFFFSFGFCFFLLSSFFLFFCLLVLFLIWENSKKNWIIYNAYDFIMFCLLVGRLSTWIKSKTLNIESLTGARFTQKCWKNEWTIPPFALENRVANLITSFSIYYHIH